MKSAKDDPIGHSSGADTATRSFGQLIIDALPAHIAVLDDRGIVIAVNRSWVRFATENGLSDPAAVCEGADYLAFCREAADTNDQLAREAIEGIKAVIGGQRLSFSLEYPCHSHTEQRWFTMYAHRCEEYQAR